MITPFSPIPRKFYRVAYQRLEEATVLFRGGYFQGAVYLAGYAVECALKALILNSLPTSRQSHVETEFRGARAHSFDWLRECDDQLRIAPVPRLILRELVFLRTWETNLRYEPGRGRRGDAVRFLASTSAVLSWVDSRI